MRFLLVDSQNLFHRASHVTKGNIDLRVGMSMHISIMSMASAWRMFSANHVVMGLECSNANNWRKLFDDRYKSNRKVARDAMTEKERDEMTYLMAAFTDLTTFMAEKTNATVLQCPVAEADDMIARWIATHPDDEHIIVSSDRDFYQLLADNVVQFNGVTRTVFATSEDHPMLKGIVLPYDTKIEVIEDTEYLLFEKIIRGDMGDNVFSAFPGVRKASGKGKPGIMKAWDDRHTKGYEWNNFMLSTWVDHNQIEHVVRDRFDINNMLVNLKAQPDAVVEAMDDNMAVAKEPIESQKIGFHFFRLCNKYDLKKLEDHAEEISRIFAAKYDK